MVSAPRLVLSCEHASAAVPARYRQSFARGAAAAALRSHRGSDMGALDVARALGAHFGVEVIAGEVTRLLIDLNRTQGHAGLFSGLLPLDTGQRQALLDRYYHPYRARVQRAVAAACAGGGPALHVSVHSFTPRLADQVRNAELGLLYDPARAGERALCARWKAELARRAPALRVRRNYPYRGTDDGLTTALRRVFPGPRYIGVELELNQAVLLGPAPARRAMTAAVLESLDALKAT
jgi:predicted N-formylglutamate amidohydrolase